MGEEGWWPGHFVGFAVGLRYVGTVGMSSTVCGCLWVWTGDFGEGGGVGFGFVQYLLGGMRLEWDFI